MLNRRERRTSMASLCRMWRQMKSPAPFFALFAPGFASLAPAGIGPQAAIDDLARHEAGQKRDADRNGGDYAQTAPAEREGAEQSFRLLAAGAGRPLAREK